MTVDEYVRFFLWLVAIFLLARAARSLWIGRVRIDREDFSRSGRPDVFWSDVGFTFLLVVLFATMLIAIPPDREHPNFLGAPIFAVVILGMAIRSALVSGTLRVAGWRFDRQDTPRAWLTYLTILGVLLVIAALTWLALMFN
jgi:hypothetical protein